MSDVFEPGSTGKVITVAAALEHGGQTPMSPYTVPYQILVDGLYPFHDAEVHPTERLTVAGILANSSNVGMVQVVQARPAAHAVPLLPQVRPRRAHRARPARGERGPAAEAVAVERRRPVHTVLRPGRGGHRGADGRPSTPRSRTAACGCAPSIVAGTTSGSGKYTPAARAQAHPGAARPHRARAAGRSCSRCRRSTTSAASRGAIIAGYSIAAKTGTAQLPDPAKGGCLCQYGSSYIGIAPAGNPQLVVAVHVQDPKRRDYFGDAVAGPVFNQVMKFALQTMQIPPDGSKPPKVRLTAP